MRETRAESCLHHTPSCVQCPLLTVAPDVRMRRALIGNKWQMSEHGSLLSAGSPDRIAFYALRSCHQVLHGDSGEFFSPDYLCSNPALWCNWTIQVPPGKRVQIYLEDLTPEQACHMKTDQIHLDESPLSAGESSILERCWRSSIYTSFSNTVHVVQLIRPNHNPPHRGFYGAYQAFGLPKTPDINEDISPDLKNKETEDKDSATKIPKEKSFSNELEENVGVYTKHVEVSDISPPLNEILTVTTGSFKEIRKIRGETKDQEPFHSTLLQDDEDEVENQLVSVPTGIPNWITVKQLFDHEPQASTTQSTSTSTTKQSTRTRAPKRKLSTTMASMNKTDVINFSHLATPDVPKVTKTPTPSIEDIRAVSKEMLDYEEHAGGLAKNKTNSKKIKQSHGNKDCGRSSVPTLLYAVCFLLCFLILLLMVALGLTYRRSHRGRFLPRCPTHNSSNFMDDDINNNPNPGSGADGRTSRSPPPPPPLRLSGGAHDLPLLRFSPLTPPDGTEGKL
ncbi:hypothetical protein C0J50_14477 [Silurus asotus]|uniref:CUB domain-containing protein n=1 Tax=Silurus asotus TaxID=30991 RepID=A0AAD5AZM7_SILAS|nr:hypothetical protein C0J50_14477 [Silurus asotus]